MAKTENIVMASGALAFAGSFKEAGGFPDNGYAVIGATTALVFLASTVSGSRIDGPIRGLAYLTLLSASLRYIPTLANMPNKRKKKSNG